MHAAKFCQPRKQQSCKKRAQHLSKMRLQNQGLKTCSFAVTHGRTLASSKKSGRPGLHFGNLFWVQFWALFWVPVFGECFGPLQFKNNIAGPKTGPKTAPQNRAKNGTQTNNFNQTRNKNLSQRIRSNKKCFYMYRPNIVKTCFACGRYIVKSHAWENQEHACYSGSREGRSKNVCKNKLSGYHMFSHVLLHSNRPRSRI